MGNCTTGYRFGKNRSIKVCSIAFACLSLKTWNVKKKNRKGQRKRQDLDTTLPTHVVDEFVKKLWSTYCAFFLFYLRLFNEFQLQTIFNERKRYIYWITPRYIDLKSTKSFSLSLSLGWHVLDKDVTVFMRDNMTK